MLLESWKYITIFKSFAHSKQKEPISSQELYDELNYRDLSYNDIDYILNEMAENGCLYECYNNEEIIRYQLVYRS